MTIHLDISAPVHRRAGLTASLSIKSLSEDFGRTPLEPIEGAVLRRAQDAQSGDRIGSKLTTSGG